MEKSRGLPLGPLNDRDKLDVPASQGETARALPAPATQRHVSARTLARTCTAVFFYNSFADPLFSVFCQLVPDMEPVFMPALRANVEQWKAIQAEEREKKNRALGTTTIATAASAAAAPARARGALDVKESLKV